MLEERKQEQKVSTIQDEENKILTTQREFECLPLLRQVYHEAPDDVFELILSKFSDTNDRGGLNVFRLVNKRRNHVAESCTTMIMNLDEDGSSSLPSPIIQRCKKAVEIKDWSCNLRSLEGCPSGLKKLDVGIVPHLQNLSPLASCSVLEGLRIEDSSITDISVVSSLPLLEVFSCRKKQGRPSIKDFSSFSSCLRLKKLSLDGNGELKDLSPLSACTALEYLNISYCPLITSLVSLSTLKNLQRLACIGIDPITSFLPLASCAGLQWLCFRPDSECIDEVVELRERYPSLKALAFPTSF